jgi:hypothetical protein
MSGESRRPEHTDRKWREAPGLLAICNEHRKAAKKEPMVDAGLRLGE